MIKQKLITVSKSKGKWLSRYSCEPGYLGAYTTEQAGLAKDLKDGWVVKYAWEDDHEVSLLLEMGG